MKEKLFLDDIREEIDRSKVISFDIFDTLLLRPYMQPTDLFLHLEKLENKPGFCDLRKQAEWEARIRQSGSDEVTLDEIYCEMGDEYQEIKQKEIELERCVLYANPEMKQVYDYVRNTGKTLVLCSDMYLPSLVLAQILEDNGFHGYHRLYVSGETRKSKYHGDAYTQMLKDLGVSNPRDILHIGDNKHSDYKKPRKFGIRAAQYEAPMSQYLRRHKRVASFLTQSRNCLAASIVVGLMMRKWQNCRCYEKGERDYWDSIGYEYAGPIAYGYCRFLKKECDERNLSHLLFVARDGYTLQKVFKTIDNNTPTSYVYAPRLLNLLCRLDYSKNDQTQMQTILDFYGPQIAEMQQAYLCSKPTNVEEFDLLLQSYMTKLIPLAQNVFKNYKRYLAGIVENGDAIGIVDTITKRFSSQKLLQQSLNNQTHGLYWGILRSAHQAKYNHSAFIVNDEDVPDWNNVFTTNWNFIEFLISSPEYPIKGITEYGNPIFDPDPNIYEIKRSKLYITISQSALSFAEDVKQVFAGRDIFIKGNFLVDWVNYFIANPSQKDIRQMSDICVGIDNSHAQLVPLFSRSLSARDFFRNPYKTLKGIKGNIWISRTQRFLLNAFKPIRIKIKGLRCIEMTLFPYMRMCHITMMLRLSEKWIYRITVGNSKNI